jgi:hypothetical protein
MLGMVDFRDPAVPAQDLGAYYAFSTFLYAKKSHWAHLFTVALDKLGLAVDGLYMWVHAAERFARFL